MSALYASWKDAVDELDQQVSSNKLMFDRYLSVYRPVGFLGPDQVLPVLFVKSADQFFEWARHDLAVIACMDFDDDGRKRVRPVEINSAMVHPMTIRELKAFEASDAVWEDISVPTPEGVDSSCGE
jgi:hypothetical protein